MTVRFEEIGELSTEQIRFYSIKLGSDTLLEFEKFDHLELKTENHKKERAIIFQTINQIRKRGQAKEYYFRPEGPAFALPGKIKELTDESGTDFGLRLYVVLIDERNVILLNGGIKTKIKANDCPNVGPLLQHATRLAAKLKKAIAENYIQITASGIEMDEGFELDI